jgi:hypothetical protein
VGFSIFSKWRFLGARWRSAKGNDYVHSQALIAPKDHSNTSQTKPQHKDLQQNHQKEACKEELWGLEQ